MDPYYDDDGKQLTETSASNTGQIYFNLGAISEDILKDGRKQYENGLGPNEILVNPQPIWGNVPASQSLIYAFDANAPVGLHEENFPDKSAFILGHEGFGFSFKKEDYPQIKYIKIPQFGLVESLNVSVAASIVMYEFTRSRGFNPPAESL
jgi:hypothetical protein